MKSERITGGHPRVKWRAAGIAVVLGGLLSSAACTDQKDGQPLEVQRALQVLRAFHTDKARYAPGDRVQLTMALKGDADTAIRKGRLTVYYNHLGQEVSKTTLKGIELAPSEAKQLTWDWTPPGGDFTGYSVEAWLRNGDGEVIDHLNTAVDVSSDWTRFPRYGYLSAFPEQSPDETDRMMAELNRYHLNALQFYDWQAKHHVPLPSDGDPADAEWPDIAGRTTSGRTIKADIDAAHRYGMAAMNYNLLYGAYDDYAKDGSGVKKEWGLYTVPTGDSQDAVSLPDGWSTPRIALFDPGNPDWQQYIIGQEKRVQGAFPFDGWHVDQLGYRGTLYTYAGKETDPAASFGPFLDRAKAELGKTVIFNNVGGYGLPGTAASATDAMYVELWENGGQTTFAELKKVLDDAAKLTQGRKATVIAAYMNYNYGNAFDDANPGEFNEPGVLLAEAAIFANGGAHIELGDGTGMLDNEYFPNRNLKMGDSLRRSLLSYYNFLTAYENVLRDGQLPVERGVAIDGAPVSFDGQPGTVWAISHAGGGYETLSLVNMTGAAADAWRDTDASAQAPEVKTGLKVKLHIEDGSAIKRAFLASPDLAAGSGQPLLFEQGSDEQGAFISFTVKELRYWDLIVLERN